MKQATVLTLAGCLAPGLLGCEPEMSDADPRVHFEYQTRVNGNDGFDYVFAEGTMSGVVRDGGSYTIPVQIYYPTNNDRRAPGKCEPRLCDLGRQVVL